ncbi:MAG: TIGR04076 family protein [Promethearchaeota archaeon]
MTTIKITVIKKFSPEEIFGQEIIRHSTGKAIPICSMEEGKEYFVESEYEMPDDFCPRFWYDTHDIITMFICGGDFEYPKPNVTYVPCRDGVRPVIFKIEKIN